MLGATPVNTYIRRRRAGNVEWAKPAWAERAPLNLPSRGKTAAQNNGLRYEQKTHKHLEAELPLFLGHLPFRFYSDFVQEKCIPDGIAISQLDPTLLTIVEIKLRHTADAWFQLRNLYRPVVSKAFPHHRVQLLEVCKIYDPGIHIPEPTTLVEDLSRFINVGSGGQMGIYLWTGR